MRKIKDIILVIFPLHLQMLEFSLEIYETLLEKKNVNLHNKFLIFIFSCGKYQTILTP